MLVCPQIPLGPGLQEGPAEEMAGTEKGQKPAFLSQSLPPLLPAEREANPASRLGEGRRMCSDKTQGQGVQKASRTLFTSSECFQAAKPSPGHPVPQHSCPHHTEAARLPLKPGISHVCAHH